MVIYKDQESIVIRTVMWIPNGKHDMGRQENNFNFGRMKDRDLKDGQRE